MTTDQGSIDSIIMRLLAERGAGKTICPSEVARAIAGSDETKWRLQMSPVRRAATALANAGKVEIRRKGRVVDPEDFKGIYRIALPDRHQSEGDGNSVSMRPDKR